MKQAFDHYKYRYSLLTSVDYDFSIPVHFSEFNCSNLLNKIV
jgi:hypothetical protein